MRSPFLPVSGVDSADLKGLGTVIGGLNQRRGTIIDSEVRDDEFTVTAEVALNDMFGYSNQLRGSTQGKGEFSMEYKVIVTHIVPFTPMFMADAEPSLPRHTCLFCPTYKRSSRTRTASRCPKRSHRRILHVPIEVSEGRAFVLAIVTHTHAHRILYHYLLYSGVLMLLIPTHEPLASCQNNVDNISMDGDTGQSMQVRLSLL